MAPSGLSITPESFALHAAWLARHRKLIDLVTAARRLDLSRPLPRGVVALTFDDGFAGLYEHALPVLVKSAVPATVFLVAGTLTSPNPSVDWLEASNFDTAPLRTLTMEQVLEMRDAGVTFGSHGYSHRDLTGLSEDECVRDLVASKEIIGDLLRTNIDLFAYPFNLHNDVVRRAVRRAGFKYAFAMVGRGRDPYRIPRVGISGQDGAALLRAKTSQWYIPFRQSSIFPVFRALRNSPAKRNRTA